MSTHPKTLYMAPEGKETWSGRLAEPSEDGRDGPLPPSFVYLKKILRESREQGDIGGTVTVKLRGGRYPLCRPVELDHHWSGVTLESMEGEEAILDGGQRVEGWAEVVVAGRTVWRADVSDWFRRGAPVNSLFVNGERRERSRYPAEGFDRIVEAPEAKAERSQMEPHGCCRIDPATIPPEAVLDDTDLILPHLWICERLPIASFDRETGLVRFRRRTKFGLYPDWFDDERPSRYYLDNVGIELAQPGHWYVNRKEQAVYYAPLPGEEREAFEATIPVAQQAFWTWNEEEDPELLRGFVLKNLVLEHFDWEQPPYHPTWWQPGPNPSSGKPRASTDMLQRQAPWTRTEKTGSSTQGAGLVPGIMQLEHVRDCFIEGCTFRRAGYYGVVLGEGCRRVSIRHCEMTDLGAGGVLMDGGDLHHPTYRHNGENAITDCHIHHCGRVFPAACGIITLYSFRNELAHNHIHHLHYSGISVGWVWGYRDGINREHRIHHNHIHHLGTERILADLGCIYLLGKMAGSEVKHNLLHDVTASSYGCNGFYADQGTSLVSIENNVIFNIDGEAITAKGRANRYARNIVVASDRHQAVNLFLQETQEHIHYPALTQSFERNLFITQGGPVFLDQTGYLAHGAGLATFANLYVDTTKPEPVITREAPYDCPSEEIIDHALADRQAAGQDLLSQITDPGLKDPATVDVADLGPEILKRIGFVPVSVESVGPRRREDRW